MYASVGGRKKRGASVLAAIVLIAVLGAIYVTLQYARSAGSFAYAPTDLTAATDDRLEPGLTTMTDNSGAATQSNSGAGETPSCDYTSTTNEKGCPCTSDKTTSSSGTIDQQCLPGCQYRVTDNASATGPTVEVVGTQTMSTPNVGNNWPGGVAPPGYVQFCAPGSGGCSSQMKCVAGGSVNDKSLLTASVAQNIPGSAAASIPNQISQFKSEGGDLSALSSDLSATAQNTDGTGAVNTGGTANIDTAQQQIQALENTPTPTTCTDGSTGNCSNLESPISTNPDLTPGNPSPTCGDLEAGGTCTCPGGYSLSGSSCNPTPPPETPGQSPASPDAAQPPNCANSTSGTCTTCDSGYSNIGGTCSPNTPAAPPNTFAPPNCQTANGNQCVTCNAGYSNIGGTCSPNQAAPAAPAAPEQKTPAAPAQNGLGSGLNSFLTGLAQGLARGMAMQQMQQAAQQQNTNNAPYGTGSDGNACPQPQQQPAASSCNVGTWQQQRQSNGCPTTWSCQTNTANTPTATLSCQPQTANVGMSISISYSCGNATGSSGTGFSTSNQLSGSATATVTTPASGATSINYALTCTNQSQTASAQCAVQVTQPSIVIIANPNSIAVGASSTVGWVTTGMQSCVISSPDNDAFTSANANNLSINGVVQTPVLTTPMTAVLTCQSTTGTTMQAIAPITVSGVTSTSTITTSSASD